MPESGRTDDLEWLILDHTTKASFGNAVELLHDSLRVRVSKTAAKTLTHKVAAQKKGTPAEHAPKAVDWDTLPACERVLTTSADGVTVRTVARDEKGEAVWRELAVARSCTPGRDAADAHTVSLTTAQECGRDLRRLVAQQNGMPPLSDHITRPVLAGVTDGGHYQKLLDKNFALVIQLLDIWHLLGHVMSLARLMWPDADPASKAARERFRHEFRDVARDHGGEAALAWLDARAPAASTLAHAEYSRVREYMVSNLPYMDYPRAVQLGVPLGSGMVESACKQMVASRLKGSGMAWTAENAANLANLRAIFEDGRWPCPTDVYLAATG